MRIALLSKKTLQQAIDLTLKSFPYSSPKDKDYPGKWLKYPVEMKGKLSLDIKYWVVVENHKVIGISGLYTMPKDSDSSWLGWTCVDKKFRGKKIGSKLLNFVIKKARKNNKKFLKLYTSTNKNERIAGMMYKKKGFIETRRKRNMNSNEYTIWMKLKL